MRIRTLLSIFLFASLLLVSAVGILHWKYALQKQDASVMQAQADATARSIADVLLLSHEYALHAEDRVAKQIKKGFAELAGIPNGERSAADSALEQIPDEVHQQTVMLSELFEHLEAASQLPESPLQVRRRQLLLGQMLTNVTILSEIVQRWQESIKTKHDEIDQQQHRMHMASILALVALLTAQAVLLALRVLRPLARLHTAVLAVAQGDLTTHSASRANDELGDLSRTFDAMAIDMVADLRREVAERQRAETALRQQAGSIIASNTELELFNRTMVGRELRMIELKEEINALCHRLGEPPRHEMDILEPERISGVGQAPVKPVGGGA